MPYCWDFESTPGELLDEQRQEAWPSCEPHLPAQAVVAPAYVVAEERSRRRSLLLPGHRLVFA